MVWIPDHIWKQQGNKIRIGGWRNNDKAGAKPGWKALPGLASAAKPWQKRAAKPPQNTVPANFPLDEARAYTGTVDAYGKLKGYGFITLDKKGVIPGDEAFVFWKDVQSDDRCPMLDKGMQVQFTLGKKERGGSFTIDAKNVRLPGGAKIAVQDALDAGKTFVGGQYLRYTGKLKFYNPKRGFGYIAIDDGYAYDREGVPKEIRCERSEMNAGGSQPGYQKDVQVEFGIWVTQREQFKGYNVTLLGGAPLPAE
jgi:cold shock CspA family protein|eukprot:TRINITY_DN10782_c0_g2_i3.p1 TRINITY_DN10782_c0_g2~~TRINITY_DN10782_c0_g2_i3.p1  ORF type:complete len:253 (-),score=55.22 TRINITY_DN10782_c0_g2_i3:214-972(-)